MVAEVVAEVVGEGVGMVGWKGEGVGEGDKVWTLDRRVVSQLASVDRVGGMRVAWCVLFWQVGGELFTFLACCGLRMDEGSGCCVVCLLLLRIRADARC